MIRLVALLLLAGCDQVATREPAASIAPALRARIEARRADIMADRNLRLHFMRCTQDCSGHAAGYRWAFETRARRADCSNANSPSFEAGCILGTQDRVMLAE